MRKAMLFGVVVAASLVTFCSGDLRAQQPGAGFSLENGDANGDLQRNLTDGVYLLSHLFLGSPPPVPLALCGGVPAAIENGDANGDLSLDISDPVRLLNWLFIAGPEPVAPCGGGEGFGAGMMNPRVIPRRATPFKTSYEELAAASWERAFGIPAAENPVADTTGEFCDRGQSGKVWFLAGTFGGFVDRSCTVPAGKAILFPLLNAVVFCPLPGETVDDLRDQVNELIDVPLSEGTVELEATIDGVPIENLFDFRAESPPFTIPAGGLIEEAFPECVGTSAVSDGFWLLIPPLSEGSHVIEFRGARGAFEHSLFGPIDAFSAGVTYEIEIVGSN